MREYVMTCAAGEYRCNSWLSLGWEIFKHRCWHLFRGEGWVD